MQMQQISRAVCDQQRTPHVPEDAPAAALLRQCFKRRPTQRPTAAALTEEVTRVNSRLTQEIARLQREVEDVRRQERALQENVQQLTQENARLTQQLLQQERQRIAPANGDRGQWWNLSHMTVVSILLVIVFAGIRLLLHCRHEEGDKSGAAIATAASCVALGCACTLAHTDKSQLRAQT
jgi:TolA-binding protein